MQTPVRHQAWTAIDDLVVVSLETVVQERTVESLLEHARRHRGPARASMVYALSRSAIGIPGETARQRFVELATVGEGVFRAVAVVVPDAAFGAATARAFVSSVRLVARMRTPVFVETSLGDALRSIRGVAPSSRLPDEHALAAALASLATAAARERSRP